MEYDSPKSNQNMVNLNLSPGNIVYQTIIVPSSRHNMLQMKTSRLDKESGPPNDITQSSNRGSMTIKRQSIVTEDNPNQQKKKQFISLSIPN